MALNEVHFAAVYILSCILVRLEDELSAGRTLDRMTGRSEHVRMGILFLAIGSSCPLVVEAMGAQSDVLRPIRGWIF